MTENYNPYKAIILDKKSQEKCSYFHSLQAAKQWLGYMEANHNAKAIEIVNTQTKEVFRENIVEKW